MTPEPALSLIPPVDSTDLSFRLDLPLREASERNILNYLLPHRVCSQRDHCPHQERTRTRVGETRSTVTFSVRSIDSSIMSISPIWMIPVMRRFLRLSSSM